MVPYSYVHIHDMYVRTSPSSAAESGTSGTSVSAAAAQAQPATRPYRYGEETTIDDEVTAMLSAALHETRCLKPQEFPTRRRRKRDQTLSKRAVPFPRAGVEKIMKAEVILCAELVEKRRNDSLARRPCQNRGDRQCGDEVGTSSCGRHSPVPAKLAGECGLLLGKAAELLATELAVRSHAIASRQGKATMQRRHVQEAAAGEDMFDFLVDVLPRPSAAVEEAPGVVDSSERNSVSGPTQAQRQTTANGPIMVAQAAAQLEFLRQLVLMQEQ